MKQDKDFVSKPVKVKNSGYIKPVENKVDKQGNVYTGYFDFKNGILNYFKTYTKEEWEHKIKQDEVYKQEIEKNKLEREKYEIDLKLKVQNRKLELTKQWLNNELTEKEYKDLTTEVSLYWFFGYILSYPGIAYMNPYSSFVLQENIN